MSKNNRFDKMDIKSLEIEKERNKKIIEYCWVFIIFTIIALISFSFIQANYSPVFLQNWKNPSYFILTNLFPCLFLFMFLFNLENKDLDKVIKDKSKDNSL